MTVKVNPDHLQNEITLGPFKKYFLTKFNPLPLCHKLSHMADPPTKNMSQATPLAPQYAFYWLLHQNYHAHQNLFIYTYIDVCFHVFMLKCIHSSEAFQTLLWTNSQLAMKQSLVIMQTRYVPYTLLVTKILRHYKISQAWHNALQNSPPTPVTLCDSPFDPLPLQAWHIFEWTLTLIIIRFRRQKSMSLTVFAVWGPVWNCNIQINKKLSCRRETARCFVSLNISRRHARSLEIVRNDTLEKDVKFISVGHCKYVCTLYLAPLQGQSQKFGFVQDHWKWRRSEQNF